MKRAIYVAMLVSGLWACAEPESPNFQGYVEGDYLYLTTPVAGFLESLQVVRGGRVSVNSQAFSVNAELENQALLEAQARQSAAVARVANLEAAHRPSEIDALHASLEGARAALRLSEARLKRQQVLARSSYVSAEIIDELKAARDRDLAQIDALDAQIETASTSVGRVDEVRAATAEAQAAAAMVEQRQWSVQKKQVIAPVTADVADIYYQVGEWVPAGQPVVSLLPDAQRKIRFFVPEIRMSALRLGDEVSVVCDGCPAVLRARIDFISPHAEYTPPLIFSRETRARLVFRVDAVPLADGKLLSPGLPVEILPPPLVPEAAP